MPKGRRIDPIVKETILKQIKEEHRPISEISAEFWVSAKTINTWIKNDEYLDIIVRMALQETNFPHIRMIFFSFFMIIVWAISIWLSIAALWGSSGNYIYQSAHKLFEHIFNSPWVYLLLDIPINFLQFYWNTLIISTTLWIIFLKVSGAFLQKILWEKLSNDKTLWIRFLYLVGVYLLVMGIFAIAQESKYQKAMDIELGRSYLQYIENKENWTSELNNEPSTEHMFNEPSTSSGSLELFTP